MKPQLKLNMSLFYERAANNSRNVLSLANGDGAQLYQTPWFHP